jgi:uncharacterized ion transporter superfamily protein YfcC
MAMLAAAGVRYDQWLKLALPLVGLLACLGAVALAVGIALQLS